MTGRENLLEFLYEPSSPRPHGVSAAEWDAERLRLIEEARQWREAGEIASQAEALLCLARVQALLDEPKPALASCRRAVQLLQRGADQIAYARAVYQLAALERAQGLLAEAQENYDAAERLFAQEGDDASRAVCLFCSAELRALTNRPGAASDAYRQALDLFRACASDLGQAHVLFRSGELVAEQSRVGAAKMFKEARDLYLRYDRATFPNAGIRLENPPLPDRIATPFGVEAWLMAKVCDRAATAIAARFATGSNADGDEEKADEAGKVSSPKAFELLLGAAVLGGVITLFGGISLLGSSRAFATMKGDPRQVLSVVLALAAGATAASATRLLGTKRPVLSAAAALISCLLVFQIDRAMSKANNAVGVDAAGWSAERVPETPEDLAAALLARAAEAAQRQAFADAKKAFEQSMALYRQLGDQSGESRAILAQAKMESARGNSADAARLYEESLALFRQLGDQKGILEAGGALVALTAVAGAPDVPAAADAPAASAVQSDRVRLTLADVRGEGDDQIAQLWQIVDQGQGDGRLAESRAALLRLQQIYEASGKTTDTAATLVRLASVDGASGHPERAREELSKALLLYREKQDFLAQAKVLLDLGDLDRLGGNPQQARATYHQALNIYVENGDTPGRLAAMLKVGDAERALGRAHQAVEVYREVLRGCGESGARKACQAEAFRRLAEADEEGGRMAEARAMYARSAELFAEAGNGDARLAVVAKLALIEGRLGDADALRERKREALSLAMVLDTPDKRAAVLIQVAAASVAIGAVDAAEDEYAQALNLYEASRNMAGQIVVLEALTPLVGEGDSARAKRYAERLTALRDAVREDAAEL